MHETTPKSIKRTQKRGVLQTTSKTKGSGDSRYIYIYYIYIVVRNITLSQYITINPVYSGQVRNLPLSGQQHYNSSIVLAGLLLAPHLVQYLGRVAISGRKALAEILMQKVVGRRRKCAGICGKSV